MLLRPVLDREAGHPREVAGIVGDEHGTGCHGMSGDHRVHAADRRSRLVQIGRDRREVRGSSLIPWQALNAEQELIDQLRESVRTVFKPEAIQQLAARHGRNA